MRTHDVTMEFAESAETDGGPVMGVKGKAQMLSVPIRFDIIRGVAPDYMHSVCIGIMKMLVNLWFDVSHRNKVFSIRRLVKEVDQRLSLIRSPNLISRTPQFIESHMVEDFGISVFYVIIPYLVCTEL